MDLISEKEVSAKLCISTKTLQAWRWKGIGPIYVKIGRSVRYRQEDISEFIQKNLHESTTEN